MAIFRATLCPEFELLHGDPRIDLLRAPRVAPQIAPVVMCARSPVWTRRRARITCRECVPPVRALSARPKCVPIWALGQSLVRRDVAEREAQVDDLLAQKDAWTAAERALKRQAGLWGVAGGGGFRVAVTSGAVFRVVAPLGGTSSSTCSIRPDVARIGPNTARHRPTLGDFNGAISVKFGPPSIKFGPASAECGRVGPKFAPFRPMFPDCINFDPISRHGAVPAVDTTGDARCAVPHPEASEVRLCQLSESRPKRVRKQPLLMLGTVDDHSAGDPKTAFALNHSVKVTADKPDTNISSRQNPTEFLKQTTPSRRLRPWMADSDSSRRKVPVAPILVEIDAREPGCMAILGLQSVQVAQCARRSPNLPAQYGGIQKLNITMQIGGEVCCAVLYSSVP